MYEQVDFGFALDDWKKCRKYLDTMDGKWSYDPVSDCAMPSFFYF